MNNLETNTAVRLRRGMGIFLAIQWNLPILLMFWYPWSVFVLAMVANCFLWSLGCFLVGRFRWCRQILFTPSPSGPAPRWIAATIWMALLGTACFLVWLWT